MSQTKFNFLHFWHYNKGKVFFAILFIVLIVIGFSQCSLGEKTPLGILYVSDAQNVDGTDFIDQIKKDVPLTSDNENGDVRFVSVCLPSDPTSPIESGQLDKLHVEFVTGDSTFYIIDEETIYSYEPDGYFCDITGYAEKYSIPEEERYYSFDGKVIAISASSNSYLKNSPLDCNSLFLAVREHPSSKASDYENTFKLLEHILSNK